MKTTLNLIKQNYPCKEGWEKLLNYLGKTNADDEILEISTILKSNGIKDAIWALCSVENEEKNIRLMAAEFAETALKFNNDLRVFNAIQASKDYANGIISKEYLDAARDAAWAAAWDAANAASAAARYAANAAWDAARDAAWAAASAAARYAANAAWDAARDAAWAAARDDANAAWINFEKIFIKYI